MRYRAIGPMLGAGGVKLPYLEGNYGHYEDDEMWAMETPELIPDFLQGWYLLADSGLDSQEKNLIQTAVGGNYALDRIAQELRTQWPDDELRRRDQQHRHTGKTKWKKIITKKRM